jgi:hypothetical protein
MSGAIPSLPQYAFKEWCSVKGTGTTKPLPLSILVAGDRGSRIRFPVGAGNFSLHHRVQIGSGVHPASYPKGTMSSFIGGKAVGA